MKANDCIGDKKEKKDHEGMEKVIIEEPKKNREDLEEVEGVHDVFFEYMKKIGERKLELIGVDQRFFDFGREGLEIGVVKSRARDFNVGLEFFKSFVGFIEVEFEFVAVKSNDGMAVDDEALKRNYFMSDCA